MADRLLARFRSEHIARLDVHKEVRGVRCDFSAHEAVMRFGGGGRMKRAEGNCGIFESEPVGVMPVRAVGSRRSESGQ